MARSPIRKSLEHLIKKVETLENQSFAQKLLIDELENKLSKAEETVQAMKDDPFGISKAITVPSVWPLTSPTPYQHVCQFGPTGPTDWTGGTHCVTCGAQMSGPTWTITSTTDSTQISLDDPTSESSDVEPILDLDISWVIPDDK